MASISTARLVEHMHGPIRCPELSYPHNCLHVQIRFRHYPRASDQREDGQGLLFYRMSPKKSSNFESGTTVIQYFAMSSRALGG
jgi:hypothetical protein